MARPSTACFIHWQCHQEYCLMPALPVRHTAEHEQHTWCWRKTSESHQYLACQHHSSSLMSTKSAMHHQENLQPRCKPGRCISMETMKSWHSQTGHVLLPSKHQMNCSSRCMLQVSTQLMFAWEVWNVTEKDLGTEREKGWMGGGRF